MNLPRPPNQHGPSHDEYHYRNLGVGEDALRLPAMRMGETMTITEMFQKPVEHLAEHAGQIRAGLRGA